MTIPTAPIALLWHLKFIIRVTSKRGWHGGIYFPHKTFSVEKKRNLCCIWAPGATLKPSLKFEWRCEIPGIPAALQQSRPWPRWRLGGGESARCAPPCCTPCTPPPRCCRTARHLANQQAPPSSGIRAERFRERILIRLQSKRFRVSDGLPCKHNTNNLLNSEIVNILSSIHFE